MSDRDFVQPTACRAHLERTYSTTPDDLWAAWTSGDRLARWLGALSSPALDPAGSVARLTLGAGDDEWADVAVVTADRPRLLELTWTIAGEPKTLLRIEFVPVDDGRTKLVIDHRDLPPAMLAGYGAGWQAYLDGQLGRHLDEPRSAITPTWDDDFMRHLPHWQEKVAGAPGRA